MYILASRQIEKRNLRLNLEEDFSQQQDIKKNYLYNKFAENKNFQKKKKKKKKRHKKNNILKNTVLFSKS